MKMDIRRGLGVALAGALAFAVVTLIGQITGPVWNPVASFALGAVALVGLLAVLGGLAWVAYRLIRH